MIALQSATPLPEWTALTPVLILGIAALILFLVDSIEPGESSGQSTLLAGIAGLGSLLSVAVTGWFLIAGTGMERTGGAISLFGGQLVVDGMSLFFTFIFGSVAALVVVASYDYVADERHQAEYYSLVLLATIGMVLMASANSLATAFVSLELLSLPS